MIELIQSYYASEKQFALFGIGVGKRTSFMH